MTTFLYFHLHIVHLLNRQYLNSIEEDVSEQQVEQNQQLPQPKPRVRRLLPQPKVTHKSESNEYLIRSKILEEQEDQNYLRRGSCVKISFCIPKVFGAGRNDLLLTSLPLPSGTGILLLG
jgi:hypothetical protein